MHNTFSNLYSHCDAFDTWTSGECSSSSLQQDPIALCIMSLALLIVSMLTLLEVLRMDCLRLGGLCSQTVRDSNAGLVGVGLDLDHFEMSEQPPFLQESHLREASITPDLSDHSQDALLAPS